MCHFLKIVNFILTIFHLTTNKLHAQAEVKIGKGYTQMFNKLNGCFIGFQSTCGITAVSIERNFVQRK